MIRVAIYADSKYPFDRKKVREGLKAVLAREKISQDAEVALSVVGARKMTQLNEQYMRHEGVTDVLSFPLNDPGDSRPFVTSPDSILRFGDIVVCYPVAIAYALKRQKLVDDVICELAEHGMMHLLGHHHE